jgi:uncharacterized membrane protein
MKWAWAKDLPGTEKWVLVSLAYLADENNVCDRSQTDLCAITGISKATLWRNLVKLEARGLIETVNYGVSGNIYDLKMV